MNRTPGWSGLSVVTLFLVFAALMAAFMGTLLLFPGKLLEFLWHLNPEGRAAFQSLGRLSSLLLFVVGAIASGAAMGIRQRRMWGWRLAVLLFSVNAVGDTSGMLFGGKMWRGASGLLISGLFLWYLTRNGVRRQFRNQAATTAD